MQSDEMARPTAEKQRNKGTHVVLFPCPLQGHLTPMLQLASVLHLHSRGLFSITIIHTQFNSLNPANYPNFKFQSISDGLSEDEAMTEDVMGLLALLNVKCRRPFHDLLARMVADEDDPSGPIACIVSDAVMHCAQSVADHLKIPRIILRTSSATSFVACNAFPLLMEKGYLPIQADPRSEMPVPELPPFRIKDLPNISTDNLNNMYQLVAHMTNIIRASSGLIYNTFDHIEENALDEMRQDLGQVPLFPIGPLHKFVSGSSSSLLPHDRSCMEWLDKQTSGSVVYVSFGSLTSIKQRDFVEIAWGLANSGQPFLWVVRPGSVRGWTWVEMPDGFDAGRGQIVKWAPQQEVLAHPSVGGFWTHNGWNSTVESISEGVPMICWPCFGDQMVNARLVSYVLKVGVQLENDLERQKIELVIRRLMVEEEGQEMRKRMRNLKEKSDSSIRKGGSSYESLDRLVSWIMSM